MVCLRRMVCLLHMCIAARVHVRCVPCWLCCRVDYPLGLLEGHVLFCATAAGFRGSIRVHNCRGKLHPAGAR
jgi:hypothetical protein